MMPPGNAYRIAVDIGGTFTDVVLERGGEQFAVKTLTTGAPAEGFMTGIIEALETAGVRPFEVGLVLHGTTLATNALIERKGAVTALFVTEGHRDSLEIAYENRFDQYDIMADRSRPLVPRRLRFPVPERVNARGGVLVPLDETAVASRIDDLGEMGVASVAVGLLHAYANPGHERRIAAMVRARFPEMAISLSSDVCPEIREYERQTTTVANAYVKPVIASYLADVEAALGDAGLRCPCLLMTSGGSLVTIATAREYPVRLIESGPAGGAVLAGDLARRMGEDRVVSFDMGGTTAKICLFDDGEPLLGRHFEVDRAHRFMKGSGIPLKIPVVEMVEIGAGGGSISSVDQLKRIQVGPQSAGADPGPACYGKGGARPTVTDANLVLGRLDPLEFAGGAFDLDPEAARSAVSGHIGEPLSCDDIPAALGIVEIVDENMAAAARVHAVERGREIQDRTMIAFGGAAPVHATRLAEKLGIRKVVVPVNAGVGSAVGFLLAPVAYEVVRSRYVRMSDFDADALNELFSTMGKEAREVVAQGAPGRPVIERRHAYARYVGQGHEIKIDLPDRALTGEDAAWVAGAFERTYRQQFGRTVPGLEVEVLTWSITAHAESDSDLTGPHPESRLFDAAGERSRKIVFSGQLQGHDTAIFARTALAPGKQISGPAAVVESQTTTIVPPGWRGTLDRFGSLVLEHEAEVAADLLSGLRHQVLWDRLIAVVEEQAQAIIRTAFSTTVREAGDLSAGVFDLEGRMLAQAVTGTPGHVNAMPAAVNFFLEKYPVNSMKEGDTFVTNDPWHGTGHLFDFTAVTPCFRNGAMVGLFASTVHVVDIGGPGFGPDAGQVYEEGLCIPIMRLFAGGEANDSVFEIIRANVREPVQVVGDLYSLAVSNDVGCRRLRELMDEFDMHGLEGIADHVIGTSRRAMLEIIGSLPKGTWEHSMTVDGYDRPVELRASLSISGDGIGIDFAGTSGMSPYGINVPITYTQAYATFGLRSVIGRDIPNNTGSLGTVRVTAPEGSILHAPRPAAVTVRHVIGQMLPDVVLGCLGQALPGRVPAEGSSSLWNPSLLGGHGVTGGHDYGDAAPFAVTIFHSGGTGARPGKDGLSATAFPSGVRNTPVEITESISPIIFRRKELRKGSGGAGRYRGGDGQVIEMEHGDGAPFAVMALFDRIDHPARGREGGGAGAPGAIRLASGTVLKGKGKQIVPAGDRLILELPGGGGLGRPAPLGEPQTRPMPPAEPTGFPLPEDAVRIGECVSFHAVREPDREAAVHGTLRMTYRDLEASVKRWAKAFLGDGVRKGDRVAMLTPASTEWLAVMLATTEIGAIWTGFHPRYRQPEFRHVTSLAEPKVVVAFRRIHGRDFADELQALRDETPSLERLVMIDEALDGATMAETFLRSGDSITDDELGRHRDAVEIDDTAVLIFTSGTTGRPKAAMVRHRALLTGARVENEHWPMTRPRLLHMMPVNHIAGVGMTAVFGLWVGGTLVLQDRFDAGDLLRLLEEERIDHVLGSPVQFHMMVHHPDLDRRDLSCLKFITWGGAPMAAPLVARLNELPGKLRTSFGMTELGLYVTFTGSDDDFEVLSRTIGRPHEGFDIRITDSQGRLVEAGGEGEIQAKGPWLLADYWRDAKATREAYTRDGWFRTGDVVKLREDGNLEIVGRTKEMFISGGFNIYPREIEVVLEEHPDVGLVAVMGVVHEIFGEVGHAFVEPRPGATVDAGDLDRWCRERMANYKVPKTFAIENELPRLPIGKIDKQTLKRRLEATQ